MAEFDQLVNNEPQDSRFEVQDASEPVYEMNPKSQEERQQEILQKLKLKTKIMHYQEDFPKQLQMYDFKMQNMDTLSIEQLEELLTEIQMAVSCRNSAGFTKLFYFSGIEVTEKIGTMIGFQISGLKAALEQNIAIHECLNEIKLKYEDQMYTPPEMRLALLTTTTLLTLHKLNTNSNTVNKVLSKHVPEQLANEFTDL